MTVAVVGAGSGIGLAVARGLVASGARTIAIDRHFLEPSSAQVQLEADPLAEAFAGLLRPHLTDGLAGLVVSAGAALRMPLDSLEPSKFDACVDGNLTVAFRAVKAVSTHLVAGASIVLLSSLNAYAGSEGCAYAAAKAGVIGLGRSLALELAPRRVRVNTVAPGPTDTPMLRQTYTPTQVRMAGAATPFGIASPDAVADVVRFLLSDAARHVTGQALVVDGGLSLALHGVI